MNEEPLCDVEGKISIVLTCNCEHNYSNGPCEYGLNNKKLSVFQTNTIYSNVCDIIIYAAIDLKQVSTGLQY